MTGYYLVKAGQFDREERARTCFGSPIGRSYGAEKLATPISLFLLKGRSSRRGSQGRVRDPAALMSLMRLVCAREEGRTLKLSEPVSK
jgi:hypothetical protein